MLDIVVHAKKGAILIELSEIVLAQLK